MDNDPTYDLFFIGTREDPRSCSIIGEDDTRPIYFSFETYERPAANKRTMISRGKDVIASFEWGPGNHLGYVYMGQRSFPMSHLMLPGSSSNARSFSTPDGRRFEWRRVQGSPTSYDLYMLSVPNIHVAAFRRYVSTTAVGPAHGLLQYKFTDDVLLLECLLSLCVQRCMDLHVG